MAVSLTEEEREIREIRQICYVQDTVREDDLLVLERAGLNVGKGHFLRRMYEAAESDLSERDTLTDNNYGVHSVYSA
ncbi:hypothetical protein AAEP93_000105 [Penicillium crustosum]